jgi:hypothetical protein
MLRAQVLIPEGPLAQGFVGRAFSRHGEDRAGAGQSQHPQARLALRGIPRGHYTPKHGSWLDMAESELGVLASQCLDRRIADKQILAHEVNAWQDHRNKHHAKANWQFKTRMVKKLKRLKERPSA